MTLSDEWTLALLVFGGLCALVVVTLSRGTGEPWLYVLAIVAPVAGFLFSRDNDWGVVLIAAWPLAILIAMFVLVRRERRRPPVRKSHARVQDG